MSMAAILPIVGAMQEPTLLILTALAAEDRHGYGVMQEVERLSEGRVRLSAGTLYRALDRLVGEGLVAGTAEEVVDGRLRRYYRLTESGVDALALEAERRRTQAEAALAALRAARSLDPPRTERAQPAPPRERARPAPSPERAKPAGGARRRPARTHPVPGT